MCPSEAQGGKSTSIESFHPAAVPIPSHTLASLGRTKMPPIPTSRKWAQLQPQTVILGNNEETHWKCLRVTRDATHV